MDKLTKVKLSVFGTIVLVAVVSFAFHLLPYRGGLLWFPILVIVNSWIDFYAKKKGMILTDEMTRQRTGTAAWWTFQLTIATIFLNIVYYEFNRTLIDARFALAYIAGYMGIVFLVVYVYYNYKQGVWD